MSAEEDGCSAANRIPKPRAASSCRGGVERSARRQELVWQLELRALAGEELGTVMDDAVALVARELDVELAGVAEILPGNGYGGDLISDLPR